MTILVSLIVWCTILKKSILESSVLNFFTIYILEQNVTATNIIIRKITHRTPRAIALRLLSNDPSSKPSSLLFVLPVVKNFYFM